MKDDQIPEIYTRLATSNETLCAHAEAQTTLLAGIHKRLEGAPANTVPFRIQVNAIQDKSGTLSVPFLSAYRGEILTVQNPTAAPVTCNLVESNGATVLNVTVAAGDYKALYVPFFDRVFVKLGTGMIISGKVAAGS
jgi:hypothetical protein